MYIRVIYTLVTSGEGKTLLRILNMGKWNNDNEIHNMTIADSNNNNIHMSLFLIIH